MGIDPALYINRELSWLEFNARVLHEAFDPRNRLLERLKFLAIFSRNLDEFHMVRVAGLRRQIAASTSYVPPDGMTPVEQLAAV
jgi:polyphosphate kinase